MELPAETVIDMESEGGQVNANNDPLLNMAMMTLWYVENQTPTFSLCTYAPLLKPLSKPLSKPSKKKDVSDRENSWPFLTENLED